MLLPAALLGAALLCPSRTAVGWPDSQPAAAGQAAAAETGTIEGFVRYSADPKRPWRLGRYYIRDRKTGRLAEAVVCVTGPGLAARQAAGESRSWTIDQKDFRFDPETISARVGDRVTFTNSDMQVHNVNSGVPPLVFDRSIKPGDEAAVVLEKAGGIRRPIVLGCKFHSGMRSWIYVFDHPFHTVTAADGRFRLSGLPPGEYLLQMVHPAGGLQASQKVRVAAGQTVAAELSVGPDDRLAEGP
jgi:plastocyanin